MSGWKAMAALCVLFLLAAYDVTSAGLMQPKSIVQVLNEHADQLMSIPGVSGVGIGDCRGSPCIKIFVSKVTPSITRHIPERLDGYGVAIEETGEFRAPRPIE
jgi:hypothetical protein